MNCPYCSTPVRQAAESSKHPESIAPVDPNAKGCEFCNSTLPPLSPCGVLGVAACSDPECDYCDPEAEAARVAQDQEWAAEAAAEVASHA